MKKQKHRLIRWLIRDWWTIRVSSTEGYFTYNPYRNTIMDTGLTKKQAKEMCNLLNI